MTAGGGPSPADVVIPHLDRAASLRRTLDSLRRQSLRPRVIVADNGSTDETATMLAAEFGSVQLLELGENLGFGTAVNRALELCTAPLVVLLNNDVVADVRMVERLVATWRGTGAEMVAACLRMPAGPIESVGVEVDRSLIAYDVWWGRDYERARAAPPPRPLAPCAGAAAYDRLALAAAGGFDEGFFAYLEDVDLGLRMRALGLRCGVALDAVAWHEHSGTLGSGSPAKNTLMGVSRGRMLWKHGSALRPWERARGWLIDGIVYAGQAVIDRNLGAVRGRLKAWRELRRKPRPEGASAIRDLLSDRTVAAALRARLGRRRPPPPRPGHAAATER